MRTVFAKMPRDLRRRIIALLAFLVAANIAAWIWAGVSLRHFPVQLGTALLAYTLGLRHAVDADHIAAIDNVTRKLMRQRKRPVGVGFCFSLGHSTIVVLTSFLAAAAAGRFKAQIDALHSAGGIIGTLVSAGFLLLIAAINIAILAGVYRSFRCVAAGGRYAEEDIDRLMDRSGLLARVFRPMFRLVSTSWHMYPLGMLFGLGFDTASEVGLLGLSAAEASRTMPVWSIMVFPALFTAGMTLIDTADSLLMLGAYGWAYLKPIRKLFYNLVVTAMSVLVALLVGGIEALGLIGSHFSLTGAFWQAVASLNDHVGRMGYLIVGVFAAAWIGSMIVYRLGGYEALETQGAE